MLDEDAFPGTAATQDAERGPAGNLEVTSSSTLKRPNDFVTLSNLMAASMRYPCAAGKRKKIALTSTTLQTISRMDVSTTLRVEACPTPAVPPVALYPR